MQVPTISAYMQCYSNKTAVFQSLRSFRRSYPEVDVTLVSDNGDDFSKFAKCFRLRYYRSEKHCDPRGSLGKAGTREYLRRIYDHCMSTTSDYVVILEEDVTTRRRIKRFPITVCGGPRFNPLAASLNAFLREQNGTSHDSGYAMCGGSIFDRRIYMECFEKENLDLDLLETLDERVIQYSDIPLTVIFLINGYSYSVWDEVSEMRHAERHLRIFRDSAFDHADKSWYGIDFDEAALSSGTRCRLALMKLHCLHALRENKRRIGAFAHRSLAKVRRR